MKNLIKVAIVLSALILQGEALKCYTCTSETDKECAHFSKSIPEKNCADPDSCMTVVTTEKYTVRGCRKEIADVSECPGDKCKECEEDLCNVDLVPANRPLCHQCKGDSDSKCSDVPTTEPTACRTWAFREKCYTLISGDFKTVTRGCMSDIGAPDECNGDTCKMCNSGLGAGCNAVQAVTKPKLKCYSCEPSDKDCAWGMNESKQPASECQKQLLFGEKEQCYTDNQEGAVSRGCLLDLDKEDELYKRCKSKGTCDLCSENGCNAQKSKDKFHSCYKCRSTKVDEKSCETDTKNFTASECSNPFQTADQGGCYILQLVNDTIRGCTMDMPKEFEKECSKNSEFCHKCDKNDCNDKELTPRNNSVVNRTVYYVMFITGILHMITYL